jgi:hypothetical protein
LALSIAVLGWASWTFFTAITGILTILSAGVSTVALIASWSRRERRGLAIAAAALSAGLVLLLAFAVRYGCCSSSTTEPANRIRSAPASIGAR